MKYPITIRRHRKYTALCKMHGIAITGDSFGGKDKSYWEEKLRADPYLNNHRNLWWWDSVSCCHIGKRQPYDLHGNLKPEGCQTCGMTKSEALCCVKHMVMEWIAEPAFVAFGDPSMRDDYPRREEWDA